MAATGTHRVTIDPARDPASVNLWVPTAFYGVIKTDNDWFVFDQIFREMLEKAQVNIASTLVGFQSLGGTLMMARGDDAA